MNATMLCLTNMFVTLETAWKVGKQLLLYGNYGHLSFFLSAWGPFSFSLGWYIFHLFYYLGGSVCPKFDVISCLCSYSKKEKRRISAVDLRLSLIM